MSTNESPPLLPDSEQPPPLPSLTGHKTADVPPTTSKPTESPVVPTSSMEEMPKKRKTNENDLRKEHARLYDAYLAADHRANSLQRKLNGYRTFAIIVGILALLPCAGFMFLLVICSGQSNGFR